MSRFRWHHACFFLAAVDAVVIVTGLWLHDRTLASFHRLLGETAVFDVRVRDLTALSEAVMQLSAPAMDVCASGDVVGERERWRRFQVDLGELKSRSRLSRKRMKDFWAEVDALRTAQQAVFTLVDSVHGVASAGLPASVAALDLHRRRAARILAGEQEALLSEAAERHLEHAHLLDVQWVAEIILALGLVGALSGMIWYTRRLQQSDAALRTERCRVEGERRERLAVIGELCTGVAHGIQNPLAAIRSSSELMLDLGTMDADTRARAEDVLTECTRLSNRVRRLLTFARSPDSHREPVRVGEVVEDIAAELASRFAERNITLDCHMGNDPLVVLADRHELASVFLELFANALDHTPSGGRVDVQALETPEHVVVLVRDNGPGVPEGTAKHIFDLFFTTKDGGSGVGLAWARRVVKSTGGTLEIEPGQRSGATFRLTLPRHALCEASQDFDDADTARQAVQQFA